MKKKLLTILLVIFTISTCLFTLTACRESQGLTYNLIITEGYDYSVISYSVIGKGTCTDKEIIIPTRYQNLPVTRIGESAFCNCSTLTSIVIPSSVTHIGIGAFYYCYSLTTIKYRGTSSQWSWITKGHNWDYNTGNYTITYNYVGE